MEISIITPVTRIKEVQKVVKNIHLAFSKFKNIKYEILLITDFKSASLLEKKFDNNIKLIICEDLHPSRRRNLGVINASYGYLAFIDDDVYIDSNWCSPLEKYLKLYDGVCGPITQSNFESFRKNLIGIAQESIFFEGFSDYRQHLTKSKYYDIPLCNVIIKKEVWDKVGGFNEIANYNIDDCEFFFLADKLGFSFVNHPDLRVEHDLMPFGISYLKKKITQRFQGGINSMIFSEIYFAYPSVRIVWFSYLGFLIWTILFFTKKDPTLNFSLYIIFAYFLISLIFSFIKSFNRPKYIILLPFVFFLIHCCDYFSYLFGVIYYLFNIDKFKKILNNKKIRILNATQI
ncbi:MAG: glycosyltransferase [Bdellovibrionales bacterium]|nr:glycosyltransferase [Bdellovibrionales bacterium]